MPSPTIPEGAPPSRRSRIGCVLLAIFAGLLFIAADVYGFLPKAG